jgi:hypothetical protein
MPQPPLTVAGPTYTRWAWAEGTFFPVVVLCQFLVLAGNRFWFYILIRRKKHVWKLGLGKRDWKYGQTCFVTTTVNENLIKLTYSFVFSQNRNEKRETPFPFILSQEETRQTAVSALLLISFLCENKKKLCWQKSACEWREETRQTYFQSHRGNSHTDFRHSDSHI